MRRFGHSKRNFFSIFVHVQGGQVEYFFASDASAIIEHTDRVIYLEDDDVAAVKNGKLTMHRDTRKSMDESANRYEAQNYGHGIGLKWD